MNTTINISIEEARARIVNAQLLGLSGIQNTLSVIKHLGYVQIDTLSVAERAHNHVLFTRNNEYDNEELNKLLSKKQIFEYWSHAASYLPMDDYRFSLYRKSEYKKGKNHWFEKDDKVIKSVINRIKKEGPLQSKDFKHNKNGRGEWYTWKPTKIALEQLFMEGRLMVSHRNGFQKVYDLTDRVLPDDIDKSIPTIDDYVEYLIMRSIKSQGLVSINEINYLIKGIKPILSKVLKAKLKNGEVIKVNIKNLNQEYYTFDSSFVDTDNKSLHILSPFDNLVIQRKRLKELFNFDYQIECYVPEAKRKYGYYCLPLLYKNQFVGRLDPKADRKTGMFTVKSLWFEPNFIADDQFFTLLVNKLELFSRFCGCYTIEINFCNVKEYKYKLSQLLS
ncbi:MAG: winged helix DNA-binding domain-containing protein [Cyclobacteriaceae bacterium]|nr:winged helix DNA-binding domain-containing protein [Cyclobacteriaceae bacterium]